MTPTRRILPLDAVLFPGVRLSVHVTEPRLCQQIRSLVDDVTAEQRRLGVVAIREGYQIGRRFGRQSAHRVGCEARLSDARARDDESWDIVVTGQRRLRVERILTADHPDVVAEISYPEEVDGPNPAAVAGEALTTFEAYRNLVAQFAGPQATVDELPEEPLPLSYALAAATTLPLRERQVLLEAPDASSRLHRLTAMLRVEMTAMRAVASLPAARVARTGWSPN